VIEPFKDAQKHAVEFSLDRYYTNIFARPGKGKTRIGLEVIDQTGVRTLIVAPIFPAMTSWPSENKKWGYNFSMRFLHGKEKRMGTEDVTIINPEGLMWLKEQDLSSYEFIVYDESHKFKNPGTSRFRKWRTMMNRFEYRMGLTGTPRGNHLLGLWGTNYVVDCGKTLERTHQQFKERWFVPHPYIKQLWTPRDGVAEEMYTAIAPHSVALDFVKGDTTELTHNYIPIEMSPEARKIYNDMRNDSYTHDGAVVASTAAVRSQKERQLASGKVYATDKSIIKVHTDKLDRLKALIAELQGAPMLVFYEFKHELESLKEEIPNLTYVDASTPKDEVIRIVEDWNADKIEVLAGHPSILGIGGNMQFSSCRDICFYTIPWSVDIIEQAYGRLWGRHGQDKDIIVHYLCCSDTKDDHVYNYVLEQKGEQDKLFQTLIG
jgi:superfamily II DNA or RNA helicase